MGAGKESKSQDPCANRGTDSEDAFDLWLKRGLHALYDEIANEPIPEELLKLIEGDRDQS